MPKFGDGNLGEAFGYQIDKRNEKVGFNDAAHAYFDLKTGSKYISVTQLVGKYEQPFDEEFWSRYKAAEALLSAEDWSGLKPILLNSKKWNSEYLNIYEISEEEFNEKVDSIKAEYKANRDEACEHGTLVHAGKENSFYENANQVVKKYGFGGTFQCIPGYYQLDLERGIYPEFLISYDFDGLRVAGQVDLLIVDGNDISIGDWKTNKKLDKTSYFDRRTKKYKMMKFPVNTVQDCNLGHYSLQLSLYMYLLQKTNPKYNCKRLFIVHIDREGKETEYEIPYLKDEVERMIANYKKTIKVEEALNKCKPMEI